jgi:hypothetical protein
VAGAVGRTEFQKGLEIEPGKFVLFTQAELDELATRDATASTS